MVIEEAFQIHPIRGHRHHRERIEAVVDTVVTIVETAKEIVQKAVDTAVRFIEDVKEACEDAFLGRYHGPKSNECLTTASVSSSANETPSST
jgi:hypothetical protein